MDDKKFLEKTKIKLLEKDFENDLKKFIEIDKKYYQKMVDRDTLIRLVEEYEGKEFNKTPNISRVQVLTIGNPEIIFRLGIEAVRNNLTEIFISVNDFCLAQNKFIVSFFNKIYSENKLKIKFLIDNLTEEKRIVENGQKYDLTLSISDSYRYDFYKDDIPNIRFYPYNIFEIYSDTDEFEEIKRKIFDYSSLNGFELVNIDEEINFQDAIHMINSTEYGFAAVLLSKDKEKQKIFKNTIKTKNVIINENPFNKVKFELEI